MLPISNEFLINLEDFISFNYCLIWRCKPLIYNSNSNQSRACGGSNVAAMPFYQPMMASQPVSYTHLNQVMLLKR